MLVLPEELRLLGISFPLLRAGRSVQTQTGAARPFWWLFSRPRGSGHGESKRIDLGSVSPEYRSGAFPPWNDSRKFSGSRVFPGDAPPRAPLPKQAISPSPFFSFNVRRGPSRMRRRFRCSYSGTTFAFAIFSPPIFFFFLLRALERCTARRRTPRLNVCLAFYALRPLLRKRELEPN